MDRVFTSKSLAKQNKTGEVAQTLAKPGMTARKVLVCV